MDFNYDFSTLTQFLAEKWWIFAGAFVVVGVIARVVETFVKWVLMGAIVLGLAVYSGVTMNDFSVITTQVTANMKDQAIQAMVSQTTGATYSSNGDGTYTVTTTNIEIRGTNSSKKVEVYYNGIYLGKWEIDKTINSLITAGKAAR